MAFMQMPGMPVNALVSRSQYWQMQLQCTYEPLTNTGVETSVAKDFINRAKEEGYLYVPTVLAEDSMQSSSGSAKKKPGRPKKPKASDFKANMYVRLCCSGESYF